MPRQTGPGRLLSIVAPQITNRIEMAAVRAAVGFVNRLPDYAVEQMVTSLRGWTGATNDPSTAEWHPSNRPINADLLADLPTLQARGFDLYRNTPSGYRSVEEFVLSIVGTGIWPRFAVETGSEDAKRRRNKAIQRSFDQFAKVCWPFSRAGFAGLQDTACRDAFAGGDVLIVKRWSRASLTAGVPLYFDILPARLLSTMYDTFGAGTNDWGGVTVNGVAYNAAGRPAAYWIQSVDPRAASSSSFDVQPIPARDIIHLFVPLQAGMNRGVPRACPAMSTMRQQADYDQALLNRKALENTFVAFITGLNPTDMWDQARSGLKRERPVATDAQGKPVSTLRPGAILSIENGTDVRLNAPSSQSDIEPFNKVTNHKVSAATGIPYNRLTGDVTNASYSGERIAGLPYQRLVEVYQQVHVIPGAVEPMVDAWADAALLMGIARPRDFNEYGQIPREWILPPIIQADRKTQVEVERLEIRNGLTSLTDCILSRGRDPERVADRRRQDQDELDAGGLIVDCDPRRYSASGNFVSGPPDPDADEQVGDGEVSETDIGENSTEPAPEAGEPEPAPGEN